MAIVCKEHLSVILGLADIDGYLRFSPVNLHVDLNMCPPSITALREKVWLTFQRYYVPCIYTFDNDVGLSSN